MDERVLICGLNWLGDSIMSMPAIQLFKAANPGALVTVLIRPELAPLWKLQRSVDAVWTYRRGLAGTLAAARRIAAGRFDRAFVLPNSFRSALLPCLGRLPARVGAAGHWRSWMLTQVTPMNLPSARRHQAWEYVQILGIGTPTDALPRPELARPDLDAALGRTIFAEGHAAPYVGLLPGAARGPSKRWPAGHFIEAGRSLAATTGSRILVLGTGREAQLCDEIAAGIGPAGVSLAGQTSIETLAAVLGRCRAVISNDSGGMHLAAAAGARVVAVFGLTDPSKTGPLGEGHRVVTGPTETHSRDIDRNSPQARECLLSITPDQVCRAALEILGSPPV